MTLTTHEPSAEPSAGKPDRRGIASRLLVPEFWASLTIITMWLAVLFVGVFGGNIVTRDVTTMTTIPAVVGVALFAAIGTASVAKRVFGRKRSE